MISSKEYSKLEVWEKGGGMAGRSSGDHLVSTDKSLEFPNPRSGKIANRHTNFVAHIQNRIKALRAFKFVYLLD